MTTARIDNEKAERWRIAVWALAVALLVAPFVAMQFTAEVRWNAFDFAVFAVLLFVPATVFHFATRRHGGIAYRLAAAVSLGTAFLLVWVNLAVGIIGSERHPANLMYAGLIVVLAGGAALSRLRARGMTRTLVVVAAAQAAIAAIAVVVGAHGGDPVELRVIVIASMVFGLLWLLSAALFWRAAAE